MQGHHKSGLLLFLHVWLNHELTKCFLELTAVLKSPLDEKREMSQFDSEADKNSVDKWTARYSALRYYRL